MREKNTGLSSYTFTRPKILTQVPSTPSHIMVNVVKIREGTSECPKVDFSPITYNESKISLDFRYYPFPVWNDGNEFNFPDMFSFLGNITSISYDAIFHVSKVRYAINYLFEHHYSRRAHLKSCLRLLLYVIITVEWSDNFITWIWLWKMHIACLRHSIAMSCKPSWHR